MSDENVKPRLTPEGKFALIVMACEAPLFCIFLAFGQPILGVSVCVCAAVVITALRATWAQHKHVWYWVVFAIALVLQVPFVLYVPWTDHAYRGTALMAFGFLDFAVVWGIIKLAGKLMGRSDEASPIT